MQASISKETSERLNASVNSFETIFEECQFVVEGLFSKMKQFNDEQPK